MKSARFVLIFFFAAHLTAWAVNPPPETVPPGKKGPCEQNGQGGSSYHWWASVGASEVKPFNDFALYAKTGGTRGVRFGQMPMTFEQVRDAYQDNGVFNRHSLILGIDENRISARMTDPAILILNGDARAAKVIRVRSVGLVVPGQAPVYKTHGIRQILTDTDFTDVEPLYAPGTAPAYQGHPFTPPSFRVRVWSRASISDLVPSTTTGGLDTTEPIYAAPAETPKYTAVFSNPDFPEYHGRIHLLQIDHRGMAPRSTFTELVETQDPATTPGDAPLRKFELIDHSGSDENAPIVRKEILEYSNQGTGRNYTYPAPKDPLTDRREYDYDLVRKVYELSNDGNPPALVLVRHTFEQYADFSPFTIPELEPDQSIVDKGGVLGSKRLLRIIEGYQSPEARETLHTYDSTGQPVSTVKPDGTWEIIERDSSDTSPVSIETKYTSWNDVPMSDKENARKEVSLIAKSSLSRTTSLGGQIVSREETFYSTSDNNSLTTTRTWTGTEWLVKTEAKHPFNQADPLHSGRPKWTENSDGTAVVYSYANDNGTLVVTTDTGAGDRNGVTAGTRVVQRLGVDGKVISETTSDIASGITLEAWFGSQFDNDGRPQRIDYSDGTYTLEQYYCCGVAHARDRTGAVTDNTYDALKRLKMSIARRSAGGPSVTTINNYHGLTTSITTSSGGNTLATTSTTRSLNGEIVSTTAPDADGDGISETTAYAYSHPAGQGETTTVTRPDGSTVITATYLDGRTREISGTGTPGMTYTYATHALQGGGEATTVVPSGTAQAVTTFADALGRTFRTVYADGAAATATFYPANAAPGSRGKLHTTTDPDGTTTTITYNAQGHRATVTEPNPGGSAITTTDSDVVNDPDLGPAHRTRTWLEGQGTQAVSQVLVSTNLQSADGYSQKSVSLNGTSITVRTVPDDGAWTVTQTQPNGTQTIAAHTDGLMVSQARKDTTGATLSSVSFTYDAFGRTLTASDSRTGTTTYSNITAAGQARTIADPGGRVTSRTFDVMGRVTSTTLPDNSVTHTSYDARGNEKSSWGSQTNPTVKVYDSQDRLIELRTFRSSNLALAPDETTTGFDATTWTYDNRGHLTAKIHADGKGPVYTYTPGGKILTRTWARSVGGNPLVTSYSYTAGVLTGTDYSDATPDVTATFDSLGRQISQSNGYATSTFSYDPATLAIDTETVAYDLDNNGTPELTRVIDRSRDSLGRDTGFELKDGSTVETQSTSGYNATTGRLASVSDGTQTFQYSYLANSGLIETVTGPAHTVTNTYATDRDVLLSKENKVGSTTVSKYVYTVNSIGQRSAVAQTGSAFPSATGWNWGYDALGQVVSAENLTTPANHRAYQYDAINNRIEAREGVTAVTGTPNYTTNNLNQYTSVGTVSPLHDDDGNMTSGQIPAGSAGLVWDAENRLTTVSISGGDTVHYLYDSQSRRIARTVSTDTTLFIYDAWNIIAEYTSSGSPFALSKTHLWGSDLSGTNASPAPGQGAGGVGGLLATTDHTGTTPVSHFPTYDGNGNISEYLDFTGTIAAHFEYDPFGNTIVNTDTANQFPYRFSTKPVDPTTGLYYYGYRFYDPVTGRWPSRDPIEEQGGVNLYGFGPNSPVNGYDSRGQFWKWIWNGVKWILTFTQDECQSGDTLQGQRVATCTMKCKGCNPDTGMWSTLPEESSFRQYIEWKCVKGSWTVVSRKDVENRASKCKCSNPDDVQIGATEYRYPDKV